MSIPTRRVDGRVGSEYEARCYGPKPPTKRYEVGGYFDNAGWEIEEGAWASDWDGYVAPCKHVTERVVVDLKASDGSAYESCYWVVPRVARALNSYDNAAICVDCIIEAVRG